jgi:hypothetical protein
MVTASPGSRVKIYTSRGQIDPNTYQVEEFDKQVAVLLCESTQQKIKVHKSRIKEVIANTMSKENTTMNKTGTSTDIDTILEESAASTAEAEDTSEENEGTTATAVATPKVTTPTETKVDFDQMVRDGFEVWTKADCEFDQPGVSVRAHCIISPDKKEFETFNTYNGSRGKNNSKPKNGQARRKSVYAIADTSALEKKRKALEKKGYTRHEIQ